MTAPRSIARRAVLASFLAGAVSACAAHGDIYEPPLSARLVQVEVHDRTSGSTLPVYAKNGRRYVVGTPGDEYSLRIRNTTAGRILVVGSVDGVNVISGDTAAPSQSGYVLEPWGSVEISGWRKSVERTAAFYFTDPSRSADTAESAAREESPLLAAKPSPSLGTGHGRNEASPVTLVAFERATESPSEVVAIRYDRRENLVALGVLPPISPRYTQSEPNPFPGTLRFTPDPPR